MFWGIIFCFNTGNIQKQYLEPIHALTTFFTVTRLNFWDMRVQPTFTAENFTAIFFVSPTSLAIVYQVDDDLSRYLIHWYISLLFNPISFHQQDTHSSIQTWHYVFPLTFILLCIPSKELRSFQFGWDLSDKVEAEAHCVYDWQEDCLFYRSPKLILYC